MADTRYLFGRNKCHQIRVIQYIDLDGLDTAPAVRAGRIYRDSTTGAMMICEDGTSFTTVTST